MRPLLLGALCLAACAAPQIVDSTPVALDSTVAVVEVPEPPIELLRKGDVLIDREPPPFLDSAFADSLQEVMQTGPYATATISTEAYGLDSLGREVPIKEVMREVAVEIPDSARAFVQFLVAWDGTPYRAEVIRVRGGILASVVLDAIPLIHFRPTWFEHNAPAIPNGTSIPYAARIMFPFSRSWLK